jgi:SAM-dependent methyltransferase
MKTREAFWILHEGLTRQGPGSLETTNYLFNAATNAAPVPFTTAIDMGCGTGAGTLFLARKGIHVTAIDTNENFIAKAQKLAKEKGIDTRITLQHTSMDSPHLTGPVDLIWAEGTMYIIGWEKALVQWRTLLNPGGILVATDCFWLSDNPSPDCKKFWSADPNMMNLEQAKQLIQQSGYEVIDTYIQPDSDWFDPYYDPLQTNIAANLSSTDDGMLEAIKNTQEEIDIRRNFGDEYAHVGFIMKKR